MTDKTQYKNIHMALAAAQSEMGPAVKGADNPHFKSKYADLADVVNAVRPALNGHGISFYHLPDQTEFGHCVHTVLCHGESETEIRCTVPLIIGKQDMHGYKSATTYAKRIGLESVTGIAPEDDDGNAAAANAKASPKQLSWSETIIAELPEDATDGDKATAISDALIAQFKRKKTTGELSNEWDRRATLIGSLEKRFPTMHANVVDSYENRVIDLTPKVDA